MREVQTVLGEMVGELIDLRATLDALTKSQKTDGDIPDAAKGALALLGAAPLGKFSRTRELASGNHSQVFAVLMKQDSKFRQNQPRVVVVCPGCETTQVPNSVFEASMVHAWAAGVPTERINNFVRKA